MCCQKRSAYMDGSGSWRIVEISQESLLPPLDGTLTNLFAEKTGKDVMSRARLAMRPSIRLRHCRGWGGVKDRVNLVRGAGSI